MEVGGRVLLHPSEYSQLVNCKNSLVRSFSVTVVNDRKNVVGFGFLTAKIRFPALLTMGCIMDMEGYSSQVSVSFTPLQEMPEPSTPSQEMSEPSTPSQEMPEPSTPSQEMPERVREECDAIGEHSVKLQRLVCTCFQPHTQ